VSLNLAAPFGGITDIILPYLESVVIRNHNIEDLRELGSIWHLLSFLSAQIARIYPIWLIKITANNSPADVRLLQEPGERVLTHRKSL